MREFARNAERSIRKKGSSANIAGKCSNFRDKTRAHIAKNTHNIINNCYNLIRSIL